MFPGLNRINQKSLIGGVTMTRVKGFTHRWAFLFPVIMAVLLVAVNVAKAEMTPQYGGLLKIIDLAEGGQPIGAPWKVRGIDQNLIRPAIENLLREDINAKYHPWLATDWKIDQAKNTITLSLRKGVKFHDGTDFNAGAVKWCIDNAIANKMVKGFNSVDVIDEHTVRINVDQYQNNMLNRLAGPATSPVSPTAFKKMGEKMAMWHPVGTGPFKFVSFKRGDSLEFAKWDGYWQKGKPYLDGMEFIFIRDPMTQQAAMQAQGDEKVHVLAVTSGEQASMMRAKGFKDITMYTGTVGLMPDSSDPNSPFSKKKVRLALSYAIDREAIVKARGFGLWAPANQIPNPAKPGHVEEPEFGKYDPEKARQLLKEAGYPNGFQTRIFLQPGLVDRDAMIAVQRLLGEVGIKVELEFPDRGKYNNLRFKGWKNGLLAQAMRMLATTNITYNFYCHTAAGQFPNMKRPDGFVDKLNASLKTLVSEKTKMEELTRMLIDDATFVPLVYLSESRILQSNVHDTGYFEWEAGQVFSPETVWLSK
jgi:peptide/nickel transport system substrate-binding protein